MSNATIETSGSRRFDLLEPDAGAISLEEVAYALANICRFTGHTGAFYSVAQHSVAVSRAVPRPWARFGLLHDAQEAYIGDVSSPLKALLPRYNEIEKRLERAVAERFHLTWTPEVHALVKHADLTLLVTEQRDLFPARDEQSGIELPAGILPLETPITAFPPFAARAMFLAEAARLGIA